MHFVTDPFKSSIEMDSPEFPGYHHVKDLGKDTSVTRTRTTTLPEQLLTCFGF